MAGLTCENVEAIRTNSLCMLSPPCSPKNLSGKAPLSYKQYNVPPACASFGQRSHLEMLS